MLSPRVAAQSLTVSQQTAANSALVASKSVPGNLDTFCRTPANFPAPPAFLKAMQAFGDDAIAVQRPLTDEDHRLAQTDPVDYQKKRWDYASLGSYRVWRRARRLRAQGHTARANAMSAAGAVLAVPSILYLLPNLLMAGSRVATEKAAGTGYLSPRTEGGVREDVVLDVLHHIDTRLRDPVGWLRADNAPVTRAHCTELSRAASRALAAIRAYVSTYPDVRVASSEVIAEAFGRTDAALVLFRQHLDALEAGQDFISQSVAPMPPVPKRRGWALGA